jgi:hypothetical protein
VISCVALSGALVFLGLAGIHIFWAFLGPRAPTGGVPFRADGSPVFVPSRPATLAVAALLLAAALILLERGGWGPGMLPRAWRGAAAAALSIILLLRGIRDFRYVGLFKRVRNTGFARLDSRYYTPLVLSLSVMAGLVAAMGG